MEKINLNITSVKDGFEKLTEEEARKWVMEMVMKSLGMLSDEFTPGDMKVSILSQLADKLGDNRELSISTVESVCVYLDYLIKTVGDVMEKDKE